MKIKSTVRTVECLCLFPLLILLGKLIRWTIMKGTLINLSKGWGYLDDINYGAFQIQLFGWDEIVDGGDSDAAGNAIAVFKLVKGIFFGKPNDFYEFEIAITIVWGLLTFLLFLKMKRILTLIDTIFIMLLTIVLSVYDFSLGKEPVQMLYFVLLFYILTSTKLTDLMKVIGSILVILLATFTFRVYFVVILLFAAVLWMLLEVDKLCKRDYIHRHIRSRSQKQSTLVACGRILAVYLTTVVIYGAVLFISQIINQEIYQKLVDSLLKASQATMSSNTYIKNWIATTETTNIFIVTLEYAVVVLRLLIPLELIRLGPKYWPYIIYQFIIVIYLVKSLKNYRINATGEKLALILWIGFLAMSAIFEVDYGAWIRHASVTYPLILIIGGMISFSVQMQRGVNKEKQFNFRLDKFHNNL
ncbi:MAG: hypothetical protein ACK5JH_00940 [Anaerocolumna sp.]